MTTHDASNLITPDPLQQLRGAPILAAITSRSLPDLTDDRFRFIPRHVLSNAISPANVTAFLKSYEGLPEQQQPNFDQLVGMICPPINECRCCQGSRCTGGRIIFAACLSLSRPDLVDGLFQEPDTAVCDAHLASHTQETDDQKHLADFLKKRLSPDEFDRFKHFTWQMRSPFVEGLGRRNPDVVEPEILEFPNNASLPWISLDKVKDPVEGVTTVQRMKIHPAHHESDNMKGDLALKVFYDDDRAEESYTREVEANLQAPQHDRVMPLLAAFKHLGRFHLILPWADGGNLADLFRNYTTRGTPNKAGSEFADWYSEDWLLAECLGLADGLTSVHQPADEALTSAQIHADIKPENILCFTPTNGGLGFTLKLADFGEARKVNGKAGTIPAQHVPHTKTYRPPEHDTDDEVNLSYDVWCLGCVFLEFITWAIAGCDSLDKFEEDRLEELDERKVLTAKGIFRQDTFFKKVSKRPGRMFYHWVEIGHNSRTTIKEELYHRDIRKQQRRHHWWLEYTRNGRPKTLIKKAVKDHVEFLRSKCGGTRLEKFLDLILLEMLVVDPALRASAANVHMRLNSLQGPEVT